MTFNAEQYWSTREFKVWVVHLHGPIRRGNSGSDVKYVRARTREGAIRTARANSFMKRVVYGRATLAMHPDWPRAIRDQCAAAGVPFFFKQICDGRGRKIQWESVPADLQIREFPR